MAATYTPLATQTLSSAVSTMTFSSIPSTYTDLVLVVSAKSTSAAQNLLMRLNSDTGTNYSTALATGSGTATGFANTTNAQQSALDNYGYVDTANNNVTIINIMSYANTSVYKTYFSRSNNAANGTSTVVGTWGSFQAIDTIQIYISSNTFTAGSNFSLYGVTAGAATFTGTTKASGGTITKDSFGYVYHTFASGSATFTPSSALTGAEALVVAGGGSGGWPYSGGGGAGGVLYTSGLSFANGVAYTCTVGAGGAGSYGSLGQPGSNSTITGSGFSTLTAIGGGKGIARETPAGTQNGGSGGGGGNTVITGGTGTVGQGYAGGFGSGGIQPNDEHGGGGGGAGAQGGNATASVAGAGGAGTGAYANWAITTSTGSSQAYGGGGGGGTNQSTQGAGGIGGGGQGANNQSSGTFESGAGVANSGGGSGGGAAGNAPSSPKSGGSGVVIIRYLGV